MTILQALAADLAGVDVAFWSVDEAGARLAREALARYACLRGGGAPTGRLIGALVAESFLWGRSDGN